MSKKVKQVVISYQTVAAALVKELDIHEGIWRVALEFGDPAGINANINGRLLPAVLAPVIGIRLVPDEHMTELSVDAAVVNPLKDKKPGIVLGLVGLH